MTEQKCEQKKYCAECKDSDKCSSENGYCVIVKYCAECGECGI
jgi:hypothetical protein